MPSERVAELVEYMVTKGLLWSDNGVLAFAPEGEDTFGRRNFMDILSVFTSPPLFTVLSGQKELGNVHESTFYKREEGPAILVLAGRSWKTKHLDWKRRLAHVEPTDEKGSSRWLGEGQMLRHAVCQSIRRILASDDDDPAWSQRAVRQFKEIRDEHPWVSADSTTLVQTPNGAISWWTFGGGVANALLADALESHCDVKGDNLSLNFSPSSSLESVSGLIDAIQPDSIRPVPNIEAMENLKFSECLSPEIAAAVFTSRFNDTKGIRQTIEEHRRIIIQTDG